MRMPGIALCAIVVLLPFLLFLHFHRATGLSSSNVIIVSSIKFPKSQVAAFGLRYIRVDLPTCFSSVSIAVHSDVDSNLNSKGILGFSKSLLPVICFRDGSPPIPDVLNTSMIESGPLSNGSFIQIQGFQNALCYPLQKILLLKLSNEQISPGVWYIGLFNGIGSSRSQSKMINHSPAYSFSANITVEGCTTSGLWGPYCNWTIEQLSCHDFGISRVADNFSDTSMKITESKLSCSSSPTCKRGAGLKIYFMDVFGIVENLTIMAINFSFNSVNAGEMDLVCFARHGAIPSVSLHDYAGSIILASLVVHSPKVGRWFFAILSTDSREQGGGSMHSRDMQDCYSLKLQVFECPVGKAGLSCSSDRYTLQADYSLSEFHYMPLSNELSLDSSNFALGPLSSNSTGSRGSNGYWIYFLMNMPVGSAGGNIHVQLTSAAKIDYEIYARHGGLPTPTDSDFYYANKTRNSGGSSYFILYDSSELKIDFYILYVKEGTWVLGLRQLNATSSSSKSQTFMAISFERCPQKCSLHGKCQAAFDANGLTTYSFCSCDRTHGGFDCSIEIISHRAHILQLIALTVSNAAAALPSFYALRQKAFSEWVLFTCSGISSGLYHACDMGTWCPLSFGVLQFMDFWLSFMAVVTTFVYLTSASEAFKRTTHTAATILTALLAITNATRSLNVVLVLAIGVFGLLIGWLIESSRDIKSLCISAGSFPIMIPLRWHDINRWADKVMNTLSRRFRCSLLLSGLIAFSMAVASVIMENSQNYWIWHSCWHVLIYSSSFFFLCSKVKLADAANNDHRHRRQMNPEANYGLARHNSFEL